MLVSYTGYNEVIVTTKENEAKCLALYFKENNGRDLENYDRHEHSEHSVGVRSNVLIIG